MSEPTRLTPEQVALLSKEFAGDLGSRRDPLAREMLVEELQLRVDGMLELNRLLAERGVLPSP